MICVFCAAVVPTARPAYIANLTDDMLLDEPEDHQNVLNNILDVGNSNEPC